MKPIHATLLILLLSPAATADLVIENPGDQGTIDGAIFQGPTIKIPAEDANAFLDLRDGADPQSGTNDIQSGFNSLFFGVPGAGTDGTTSLTDPGGSAVDDQEQSKNLPLSAVPTRDIGGTLYREFALGVNQTGNGPIDITQLQIGQSDIDNEGIWSSLNVPNVYTMSTMDVTVRGDVHSGTGIDLLVYVQNSLFDTSGANDFVYLFTEMGGVGNGANDGQDRWLTNRSGTAFIPEPSAFLLLGLIGFCVGGRYLGKRFLIPSSCQTERSR